MSIKELVAGGIITVVIGGTAYTVNQTDVVNNFADNSGMSQQEAEEYVNNVKEEDLVPYEELGAGHVRDGEDLLSNASEIDCINYEYEWQTATLSCERGKSELTKTANDEIALGRAYQVLGSDSASSADITTTIELIDQLNVDYGSEAVKWVYGVATIDEAIKTNIYNKSLLQAALESI